MKAALPSIEKQMEICGPLDNEFSIDEIIFCRNKLEHQFWVKNVENMFIIMTSYNIQK